MNNLRAAPSVPVYVGTSGWQYHDWAVDLYAGVPYRAFLQRYAEHFAAVEVNSTFYRQVRASTMERWRSESPDDFRFAVKAHRYLTHIKRLRFEAEALERQKVASTALGEKLAVVLWQLPPSLRCDLTTLGVFLDLLHRWTDVRHAIEFRHASWFQDAIAESLGRNSLAVCISDAADWPMWDTVTTDLVYLRLHGHDWTYRSDYGEAALGAWADRIRSWHSEERAVHVYFDNTAAGAAWRNALRLKEMLGV